MAQASGKDSLLKLIRERQPLSLRQQLQLTCTLSLPAVLANASAMVMNFIDAAMVGQLGADDSASVGLMGTTSWLFEGVLSAFAAGYAVQVAHLLGAKRNADARQTVRQAIVVCLGFSLLLAGIGLLLCRPLPVWLGAEPHIREHATIYFGTFMLFVPFFMIDIVASSMLRSSGNMRIPSILNILMCVLDVIFNFFLIFPTREVLILGQNLTIPGAGLGVMGAALGTASAGLVISLLMAYYLVFRSNELRLTLDRGSFKPTWNTFTKAIKISTPMGLQHIMMCSASIVITGIVAPLGSIALAANSFGITAESLCYMSGYGIADAATTLIGQSLGAGRKRLTRSFAWITVLSGMTIMGMMAVLMYVFAPELMGIMSPVPEVVELGARCLRVEAWAEPLFAAAIISYGVFVGAGYTLVPCGINLVSMWIVRLGLSALLVTSMGLYGVWLAMAIELCFRGTVYLLWLSSKRWMKKAVIS
ncbi:MAG: MATE family efflux transporter [Muribaculaceae bacterium]|nr:MATE family efflux transporter [Muribaculaceae bacterium]